MARNGAGLADIFISYARSTEGEALRIAEQLRALGYAVWRDDELPAHRAYSEVIEERLRAARAVVVLWSAEAVRSQWVRAEADLARQAGTLVQLSLDGAVPPLPFNQIQCASLAGWQGEPTAPGWRKVLQSLADLVAPQSNAAAAPAHAPTPPAPAGEPLLAVLAFNNVSGDPKLDYFSDGLSEEILETVLRTSQLRVIARSSSFSFRGPDKAASRVAAALKVTHLLDGSVRRSGERVRISAQLVDCATEMTVWSDRFDRELSDIFALQDEIAEAVAAALKTTFAPSASVAQVDPAAFDLYLQARTHSVDIDAAPRIALLERAVARAPGFGAAWAALALARAVQARNGPLPKPYATLKAGVINAAETALKLDPNAGLAYVALSRLEPHANYAAREALLRRAVEVGPNQTEPLAAIGTFYRNVGFATESLMYATQAYELDPLYPEAASVYGAALSLAEQYEASVAHFDTFRERWPELPDFTTGVINYSGFVSNWDLMDRLEAIARAREPMDQNTADCLKFWTGLRRDPEEVRLRLTRRLQKFLATGRVPIDVLVSAVRAGLKEEAFAAIAQASFDWMFQEGGPLPAGQWGPGFMFDPAYGGEMQRDIRFVDFCHRLGLCAYWVAEDRWPECADAVAGHYDFRAEARRLVAAAG